MWRLSVLGQGGDLGRKKKKNEHLWSWREPFSSINQVDFSSIVLFSLLVQQENHMQPFFNNFYSHKVVFKVCLANYLLISILSMPKWLIWNEFVLQQKQVFLNLNSRAIRLPWNWLCWNENTPAEPWNERRKWRWRTAKGTSWANPGPANSILGREMRSGSRGRLHPSSTFGKEWSIFGAYRGSGQVGLELLCGPSVWVLGLRQGGRARLICGA